MFLEFTSDEIETRSGFRLEYTIQSVDPCGDEQPAIIHDSSTGDILSPNHPNNYPLSVDCTWAIKAANGEQRVTVTFTSFNLESE